MSRPPEPATETQIAWLYDQWGGFIHRRCLAILGDEASADDAVQEVFARAMRSWGSWDGTASRATWLVRIARNHCLNELRNRRGRGGKLLQRADERPGLGSGPGTPQEFELQDLVRAVLDDMDPDLARLAILYFFEDMTQQEIALEVGLSVPTVRKRLRDFVERARVRVALGLEEQLRRAAALGPVTFLLCLLGGLS
jgi:RNA polymerase sigma-70 factor (ECF subfamily)